MIRLAVFSTQPAPYHSPLWRELASYSGLDMTVYYFNDKFVRGGFDENFGVKVAWDVPMLEGYKNFFLCRDADLEKPWNVTLGNPKKLLSDGKFDAILLHGYTFSYQRQILRAAKELGIKVIMRGEFSIFSKLAWWKKPLKNAYLKWFFERVDVFGVIGENSRLFLSSLGIKEDRMIYSPYGVDTIFFDRQKTLFSKDEARKKLGFDKKTVVALFSGKLIERKQPLLLLKALARVPEVQCLVVGDGPQMEECRKISKKILKGRVRFVGFVNQTNLGSYFGAADFFVLPSLEETWGLVVNEAMEFGMPVIVSDRVGCRFDLVKSGHTGFVFPVGNELALAKAVRFLAQNEIVRRQMGRNAKAWISSFTAKVAAQGLLRAIEISTGVKF